MANLLCLIVCVQNENITILTTCNIGVNLAIQMGCPFPSSSSLLSLYFAVTAVIYWMAS